jgi:hypothetical protein
MCIIHESPIKSSSAVVSKPERTFRIVQFPSGPMPGVMSIKDGKKVSTYAFRTFEVSTLMGKIGLEFEKIGIEAKDRKETDEPHHVLVFHGNSFKPQCDCIGYSRYGYCRHSDVASPLLACIERDRKPQSTTPAPKGFPCDRCGEQLTNFGFGRKSEYRCLACDLADAYAENAAA